MCLISFNQFAYFSCMKKSFLSIVLLFSILLSCKQSKKDLEYNSLVNHWEFSQKGDSIWKPATVPGTVQTDLLNLGEIAHPFIGTNEDSIQWISEKNWTYKTRVSLTEETLLKSKHFIRFEGLDTYADIFLNDSLITKTNNAFRSWEVDVSDVLKLENELKIILNSTDLFEKKETEKLDYELPESPRIFTRKPQYQFGWDWGPTIKTMGITKDISLISYDKIRFKNVFLKTNSISVSKAEISAELTIHTQKKEEVIVQITNNNTKEIFEFIITIFPEQQEYEVPFLIKNPELWWTHNLGDPYLYNINVELLSEGYQKTSFTKNLGIRSIELVTEKDSI